MCSIIKFEWIVTLLLVIASKHSGGAYRLEGEDTCPTACTTAQKFVEVESEVERFLRQATLNVSMLKQQVQLEAMIFNEHKLSFEEWKIKASVAIQKRAEQLATLESEKYEMLRQTMISQQQFQILRHEWNASQDLIRSLQQQQAELKRQCKKRYELLQPCPMSPTGRDCADVYLKGGRQSGIYLLTEEPDGVPQAVFCDQETDGGGWTIIQKHISNKLDFNQNWISYKHGFGDISCDGESNFWLGNENIHKLTTRSHQHMRIDIDDWTEDHSFAVYTHFRVGSEETRYTLTIGGYRPGSTRDIGDGFSGHNFGHREDVFLTKHQGMAFSTFDRDNDRYLQGSCARYGGGGWWYNSCSAVNLNGVIYEGGDYQSSDTAHGIDNGMIWSPMTGLWYSLKRASMKIRPASFKNRLERQTT